MVSEPIGAAVQVETRRPRQIGPNVMSGQPRGKHVAVHPRAALPQRPSVVPEARAKRDRPAQSGWFIFAQILFGLYLVALLLLTLWPDLSGTPTDLLAFRTLQFLDRSFGIVLSFDALERVSNFLMFIPLGMFGVILLSRYFPRLPVFFSAVFSSAAGLALSTAIEFAQYEFLPDRVPDFWDIIMNGLGAFLGAVIMAIVIGIYRLLRRFFVTRPDWA